MNIKKFQKVLLVSLLSLTPMALLAQTGTSSGSSGSSSSGSSTMSQTGAYINDSAITTKVKSALLAKKGLTSTHIQVQTTSGVVTLSGTVPSKTQIKIATTVTKGVSGVQDVHNVLTVDTGSGSS